MASSSTVTSIGVPITAVMLRKESCRVLRFTWHLGPPGAEPVVIGFDVAVLNGGGQIRSVYGFLDQVPAA